MLRSMTGYGRGESIGDDYAIHAEIRSVNGRFLKIHCKLPTQLTRFETDIEKYLKRTISRGTVDIYLKFEHLSNPGGYTFNSEVAHGYWMQLRKLQEDFGVEGQVTFELLSTLPGVLVAEEESEEEIARLTPHIEEAVMKAAERVVEMREKEGAELRADLLNHINTIKGLLEEVRNGIPGALEGYTLRLRERIKQLLRNTEVQIEEQDLAREIVFYVERSDISEELARMASHLVQLDETLNSEGSIGRQLEFLGQEMHREANTMGAKVNDAKLSTIVTAMKTAVDKIREQVLNIE